MLSLAERNGIAIGKIVPLWHTFKSAFLKERLASVRALIAFMWVLHAKLAIPQLKVLQSDVQQLTAPVCCR